MTPQLRIETPDSSASPSPETARGLAVMRKYAALEAPQDGAFDRIARIAATMFTAPIASVTILDEDRVWFAASQGLDGVRQIGTEPGLCASVVLQDQPYVVHDAQIDPRTLDHPLVRGELGLRFYAASPIITSSGHALGTVNVIDLVPRDVTAVTDAQICVLTDLAATVADQLEVKLAALDAVRNERQDRPPNCQLGPGGGCPEPAVIKLADSWGDSAWGCPAHGEEALTQVPSAFMATERADGLAGYLRRLPSPV
jgi:hypothetical protein